MRGREDRRPRCAECKLLNLQGTCDCLPRTCYTLTSFGPLIPHLRNLPLEKHDVHKDLHKG